MPYPLLLLFLLKTLDKPIVTANHICQTPVNQTIDIADHITAVGSGSGSSGGLRITPYYTPAFEVAASSARVKAQFVQPALSYWAQALTPRSPISGNLFFSRQCNQGVTQQDIDVDGETRSFCTNGCKSQTMCYTEPIPERFLDQCREIVNGSPQRTGPAATGAADTDTVVIVDASPTSLCSGGVLAYATTCQLELTLDRPILGYINICPGSTGFTYPASQIAYDVVLHELGHVLGFSSLLYAFMRDDAGNPRTPRNTNTNLPNLGITSYGTFRAATTTIDTVTRSWMSALGTYSLEVSTLKTPNVLAYARDHFNCPGLDGVDLENQGGAGTAMSHFEKRIGNNELMTGSVEQPLIVSPLTLSFFKDTGWYDVDMTKAGDWRWGEGLGCTFVQKSCYEYQVTQGSGQSMRPWCAEAQTAQLECLTYENAFGQCDLRALSAPVEAKYQYFREIPNIPADRVPYFGGVHSLMDRCSFIRPWFGDSENPSSFCDVSANQAFFPSSSNKWLEFYGPNSYCLDHDLTQAWTSASCDKSTTMSIQTVTCHRFLCSGTLGLTLVLEGKSFQCPQDGGTIQIDTVGSHVYLTGYTDCPPCSSICTVCPLDQALGSTPPDPAPNSIPCRARIFKLSNELVHHIFISLLFLAINYFFI